MKRWDRSTRIWVGVAAAAVIASLIAGWFILSGTRGGSSEEAVVQPVLTPSHVKSSPAEEERRSAALATYEKFWKETNRVRALGGADGPTPVLMDTTVDPFTSDVVEVFRYQRREGLTVEGTPTKRVRPAPGVAKSGSDPLLTLSACEDGRATLTGSDGQMKPGVLVRKTLYLVERQGAIKIVDADSSVVESCAL